jgi:hypothetical protein
MESAAERENDRNLRVQLLALLRAGFDEANRETTELGYSVEVLKESRDFRVFGQDSSVLPVSNLPVRKLLRELEVLLLTAFRVANLILKLLLLLTGGF